MYLGLPQISKTKLLVKIGNDFKSLTITVRIFILDIWQGREYVPDVTLNY